MPYGRRRTWTRRKRTTRRTLAPKSIKRRTSARSQSKQILSLSRRLKRVSRNTYENCTLYWQRDTLPIATAAGTDPAYVCPIPYAPCDPNETSPIAGSERFADNRQIASQQFFTKRWMFGRSNNVDESGTYFHTGSILRYQILTTEPSYTKVTIALVRPKKHLADQLTLDRSLKGTAAANAAGSAAAIAEDIDYHSHDGSPTSGGTLFGTRFNHKYWDILYKREVALSVPGGTSFNNKASGQVTDPANNALVASGTIKIPAGGICQGAGKDTQLVEPTTTSAAEMQFVDQKNEKSCYLVAILNDATVDLETVSMGFVVEDRYKSIV